jgi:hypothetical protein
MGSQWRLAPSAAVNLTSCRGPRSRSYRAWDWPGQNCSSSGSVISSGVVAEILEMLREAEAGLARPLPARGAPSLLARRPAPPAEVADPGSAG